jgi:sugar/nucleoside kinase (ribokinase family)
MLCLDMHLHLPDAAAATALSYEPGRLKKVGPMPVSPGGVVANTGLALCRLGLQPRLVGKLGNDGLGRLVLELLQREGLGAQHGIRMAAETTTPYTIAFQPAGADRMFLHHTGAADDLTPQDVSRELLAGAALLHFGYPPTMRGMYHDQGRQMREIFATARSLGLTTSLDMSYPDPNSEAGQLNWLPWFAHVLDTVDVILPSFDELLFMLEPQTYAELLRAVDDGVSICTLADTDLLGRLAERLLAWGVAVVIIKLGDQGLYLRTTQDSQRLAGAGKSAPTPASAWVGRELLAPCFSTQVVATTGSGDATIAGFLAALLHHCLPEEALTLATATGASSVEAVDPFSGIPSWPRLEHRVRNGWARRPIELKLQGGQWSAEQSLWFGPQDITQRSLSAAVTR